MLAQVISHFLNVENDRNVKESEEDYQREENQFVIRITGMKGLKKAPDRDPGF